MKITIEITPDELTQLGIKGVDLKDILLKYDSKEESVSHFFSKWSDSYFSNIGSSGEFEVRLAHERCQQSDHSLRELTGSGFKRHLNKWCEINGYHFEDRIMKGIRYEDSMPFFPIEFGKFYKVANNN